MIHDVKETTTLKSKIDEKSILANFPVKKPMLTSDTTSFIRCEPCEVVLQSKFYL